MLSDKVYIEVICPVCGKMMGKINIRKYRPQEKKGKSKYYLIKESVSYLDYLKSKWDENKDWWGCVRDASGGFGAGFPIIEYLKTETDDPELFRMWKEQILRGLKWVYDRGWLTKDEILSIF